jgi:hypothetical protein
MMENNSGTVFMLQSQNFSCSSFRWCWIRKKSILKQGKRYFRDVYNFNKNLYEVWRMLRYIFIIADSNATVRSIQI